jgi:hypothetical protein
MTLPNRLSLASKFFVPLSTSAYVDIPDQDGGPFFWNPWSQVLGGEI